MSALLPALLILACSRPTPEAPSQPPADAFYVGAAACTGCHAGIARSFASTGMGRSLYPMEGAAAAGYARFPDTVTIAAGKLAYSVFEKDGRFYQKQYQVDAAGHEVNVDVREARYVIGSGNHSRSFVTVENGRLYQMPLCWYPQGELWDLCPGFEARNHYFAREIDDTCLFCHNGRVRTTGGFSNEFEEPFPHGIGCERCHGPGSAHVALWSENPQAMATDDTATGAGSLIVNPARLPPERSIQVCMQCHLGDSAQTERVLMHREDMLDYRPGLPLQRFMAVYRYARKLPGSFGLTGQADRLSLSRCYRESGGRLQCITCHDPHLEVYEVSAARPDHFNRVCADCHGRDGCAVPAGSRGGDCVGCHMRRAEPHDQRHTTFLDHWIRRRPGEDLRATRRDFTLEPFFDDQSSYLDAAQSALALGRAYFNKRSALGGAGSFGWDLSITPLEEASRLAPADPAPWFYLGKVDVARGRLDSAVARFRSALAADPNHVDSIQELGSALLALGRTDEAERQLERAIALGPRGDDRGAVYNELGRVALQRGAFDEARARFLQALEIEPFSFEALANLGLVAQGEGDGLEAVSRLRRALVYAPNHAAIHGYLAEALARAGPQHDPTAAVAEARLATGLDPASPAAWLAQTAACRAASRAGCALEAAQRAVTLSPRDPAALLALGVAMTAMGHASEATAPLRLALEIQPDLAAAETALGRIYLAKGQMALAREHLERALALGDEEARGLLERAGPS